MPNKTIRTLKVGILGEPNTGKSTLFNTILKRKYSIVTRKAHTTDKNMSAVLTKNNKQIIITDTPGIVTYKKNINRAIFKEASNVALDVDVVLLLFDIKKDNINKIESVIKYFDKYEIELILLLNKVDLIESNIFFKKVSKIKDFFNNKIIFSISAKKNIGVNEFINYLLKNKKFIHEKPYQQNDLSTNATYLTEIVREKVLENIHNEIPFNLRFIVDKIEKNKDSSITIHITILLKKNSYKPIILGKKGENIKKISMLARKDLERNFHKKFHLYIYLKILSSNKKNKNKGLENGYMGR